MKVSSFPAIVNVNVFRGRCPCRCVHCPVGRESIENRAKVFGEAEMSWENIRCIVDQMAEHRKETALRIHSVGEPLHWRYLRQAARYMRDQNVNSWLFTSAALDCPERYQELMEAIDIIEVSVNSTDAKDYEKTKGIDAYPLVERNIRLMSGLRGRGRLLVSRVQSADRQRDDDFVAYWKQTGLVDDAFVRSFHSYNDILRAEVSEEPATLQPCLVHFARFNIDTDGMAVVCFNELFKHPRAKHIELGNVFSSSIQEIWQGEALSRIREASLSGNYDGLNDLFCPRCTFCQPLNTARTTSEFQIRRLKEAKP